MSGLSFHQEQLRRQDLANSAANKMAVFDLRRPLGFMIDGTGVVHSVVPGSQASAFGCCPGWRVIKLGSQIVGSLNDFKTHLSRCRSTAVQFDRMVPCAISFRLPPRKGKEERALVEIRTGSESFSHDLPKGVPPSNRWERSKLVPEPQPKPIEPELASLGGTAALVRGSAQWQRSRAPLRRGQAKPGQIVEVLVEPQALRKGGERQSGGPASAWGEENPAPAEWIAAALEKDMGLAGRKYTLLEEEQLAPKEDSSDEEDSVAGDSEDEGSEGHRRLRYTPRRRDEGSDDDDRAYSIEAPQSIIVAHDEIASRVRPIAAAARCRVTCFLCGKEAGLASLKWHFQKCLLKWDRRVALPQRHAMEMFDPRCLPSAPGPDLDAYNFRAKEIHRNTVMPRCPRCFKTFNVSSIISHVNNCCKGRPALIAEITARYDPAGYQPLGEKLMRCKPTKAQTPLSIANRNTLLGQSQGLAGKTCIGRQYTGQPPASVTLAVIQKQQQNDETPAAEFGSSTNSTTHTRSINSKTDIQGSRKAGLAAALHAAYSQKGKLALR